MTYYIAHHGRKGMKWGQHIFGKARDAVRVAREKHAEKAKRTEQAKENEKVRKTNPRNLTNEQLNAQKSRMDLERNFLQAKKDLKQAEHPFMNEFIAKQRNALVYATAKVPVEKLAGSVSNGTVSRVLNAPK